MTISPTLLIVTSNYTIDNLLEHAALINDKVLCEAIKRRIILNFEIHSEDGERAEEEEMNDVTETIIELYNKYKWYIKL